MRPQKYRIARKIIVIHPLWSMESPYLSTAAVLAVNSIVRVPASMLRVALEKLFVCIFVFFLKKVRRRALHSPPPFSGTRFKGPRSIGSPSPLLRPGLLGRSALSASRDAAATLPNTQAENQLVRMKRCGANVPAKDARATRAGAVI